jgi:hypothetical protein
MGGTQHDRALFVVHRNVAFSVIFILLASSCSILQQSLSNKLSNGYYWFHEPGKNPRKVYVVVDEDSLAWYDNGHLFTAGNFDRFSKPSFDIDILTVPFKYRPSSYDFPRQLDNSFNGNLYFGYRRDVFRVRRSQTPVGIQRKIVHHGYTVGFFGGFGSSPITPWTTNYRTTDEYSGFIVTRGIAAMTSLNSLTVGFGIGWDSLTDRDKEIWIYQNKPWFGVTIGLSIN